MSKWEKTNLMDFCLGRRRVVNPSQDYRQICRALVKGNIFSFIYEHMTACKCDPGLGSNLGCKPKYLLSRISNVFSELN